MTVTIDHDVLILGAGLAGLRGAVEIARQTNGEANIGIGYLLATAGSVAAVVLGTVGITRFGHGPDPRIRD